MKPRGDRRPNADVDRDAIKIALLVREGKSARQAGIELGIAETTARRLAKRGLALLPKPQSEPAPTTAPKTPDGFLRLRDGTLRKTTPGPPPPVIEGTGLRRLIPATRENVTSFQRRRVFGDERTFTE